MWRRCCVFACVIVIASSQFLVCHDDPMFEPVEGVLEDVQFTWLGILQYIHVKTGVPHYFRAPRVVLVHEQFVLSTAANAAIVPGGFALGNVVFTDYERDEEECGLSLKDIGDGVECDVSVLLMPIADVLLHPEYTHFGAEHSVALLKLVEPVKSHYMLPVCLPLVNFLNNSVENGTFYHVDQISTVPRDYVEEEKKVTILNFLSHEECFKNDTIKNASITLACSTDCALRSGAPTIIHEHTGHFTLVSLAVGGRPCPDPLLTTNENTAPLHILINPYSSWISSAISGKSIMSIKESTKDSPFGPLFAINKATRTLRQKTPGWSGHWWMTTDRCYDRGKNSDDMFKFYHEVFQLIPRMKSNLTYYLRIDAALNVHIVCVKVAVPYRLAVPKVQPISQSNNYVKIKLNVLTHKTPYRIQVGAWGKKYASIALSEEYYG